MARRGFVDKNTMQNNAQEQCTTADFSSKRFWWKHKKKWDAKEESATRDYETRQSQQQAVIVQSGNEFISWKISAPVWRMLNWLRFSRCSRVEYAFESHGESDFARRHIFHSQ